MCRLAYMNVSSNIKKVVTAIIAFILLFYLQFLVDNNAEILSHAISTKHKITRNNSIVVN